MHIFGSKTPIFRLFSIFSAFFENFRGYYCLKHKTMHKSAETSGWMSDFLWKITKISNRFFDKNGGVSSPLNPMHITIPRILGFWYDIADQRITRLSTTYLLRWLSWSVVAHDNNAATFTKTRSWKNIWEIQCTIPSFFFKSRFHNDSYW